MSEIPNAFTRRQFLYTGLALASASATLPNFLHSTAFGLPFAQPGGKSIPGVNEDHILVVVQLSGGNDGLNTVIPFGEDAYYKARNGIGIPRDKVVKLGETGVGFHPAMGGMADLYNDGLLAVVQGVGYPNPNRSHFKSMDIWHTADTSGTGEGWLGRYFDSECCGFGAGANGQAPTATTPKENPTIGIAIGADAPLAMRGTKVQPIAFESADRFRWTGQDYQKGLQDEYLAISNKGTGIDPSSVSNHDFLNRTALDAQVSSETIRKAVSAKPRMQYPGSDLARQLQMVASMIHAKLNTRVFYVSMGGFDTHSGQGGENGRHANLLRQLAEAMRAFYRDLKAMGRDQDVLTMTFSEFGRRVSQNASQGTDHGTAAPLFLAGPMVKAGVLTPHPSLRDLDQGDLKYTVDFREVYAGVLEKWLSADSKTILERKYTPAPVFKA